MFKDNGSGHSVLGLDLPSTEQPAPRTWYRQRIFKASGLIKREHTELDFTTIIKECLKGNRKAQKVLFDHFAPGMLYLCRRYATDAHEAEDMMQEGFIRMFRNLEKFRNAGSFEGWVRRIFVNTAIKYYHQQRNHNTVSGVETIQVIEYDDPGVIDTLSERELLKLLTELPDGYRVVFNLYAIEGYSHAEIAEMLSIQESTSRSQLVKARKMLQTKINEQQRVML